MDKEENPINRWSIGIISGAFILVISQSLYLTTKVGAIDVAVANIDGRQQLIIDQIKTIAERGTASSQRNEVMLSLLSEQVRSLSARTDVISDKAVSGHDTIEQRFDAKLANIERRIEGISKNGGKGS